MNASVLPKIDPAVKLPPRMEEIVDQVAKGFPAKTVADMFGISRRTVEAEVLKAKQMTGARNIVELAWYFICRDLNVRLVIEDGKRKILAGAFLILFLVYDFSPLSFDMRTRRSRRGKDDYEYLCETIDFTTPELI